MAELNPPFALQNAGATHTAAGDRLTISGLLAGQTGSSLVARGGVNPTLGSELNAAQTSTPSMAIQVFSGICYVAGTEATTQGLYACVNDSSKTITVATAHGTLPRIDTLVARVYDSAYSGALNEWRLEIVAGLPAAFPVAPTLPNNCLPLFNINVGAAVTSITTGNLQDRRVYVASVGGVIPIKDINERDSLTSFVNDGQLVIRRDTGVLEVKLGGVWQPRSQQRILVSNQASNPPLNVTGAYVDFTSAAFPPITFFPPPSGMFRVIVSGNVSNINTATSTAWMSYRLSGGVNQITLDNWGVSTTGSRVYASKSWTHTGAPAGVSTTVTPVWNISSGSSGTAVIAQGQITVELLP